MHLSLDLTLAADYTSPSQRARVLTEYWVDNEVYCPNCGHPEINRYGNNEPVADFFCASCREDYELKSKRKTLGNRIVNGAYRTMIERLQGSSNPSLFLLDYDLQNLEVLDFLVIPKHFFVPEIIEERKPLSLTARRAGWVGCNILLQGIPQSGRIFFVRNHLIEPKEKVLAEWQKTLFLREEGEAGARGWLLDIMHCIEKLGTKEFTLFEIYSFEAELSEKHPDNRHIRDKIRQQLQVLRDKGYLEFVKRGRYRVS